jgi:hypothetical protein
MTVVHVVNDEPMWVRYRFAVDVPDGLTDDQAKAVGLAEAIDPGSSGKQVTMLVEGAGEPCDTIDGMDQMYKVDWIER